MNDDSIQGRFISFEGIDGCGKSTQLRLAEAWLRQRGIDVVATREPGDTPLGAEIRRLLLDGEHVPCAEAELFLFLADRAEHVQKLIRPALERGAWVLCDRYSDSTLAYQLAARSLSAETDVIEALLHVAECGVKPQLTLWFDLDPETAATRMRRRRQEGEAATRLDDEADAFHRRVASGFAKLHRRFPERIHRIDAGAGIEDIHRRVVARLQSVWPELADA